MEILNNFTYPVIKVDDRDPDVSWANHLKRGSAGGVDLAYPYGSPVYAPADGSYQYFDGNGRIGKGSGGNIGRLRLPNGSYIEFMHLSSGRANGKVKTGDFIGKSGASGFGNLWHYSPHLHVHIYIGGVRRNLWHYFTGSATAGSGDRSRIPEAPKPPDPIGPEMKVILHTTHAADGSGKVTGVLNYVIGEFTLRPLATQIDVDTAVLAFGPAIAVDDARFALFAHIVNDNLAALKVPVTSVSGPSLDQILDGLSARLAA